MRSTNGSAARVRREEDRGRRALAGDAHGLRHRLAAPQHESAATLPQLAVEVPQRAGEEAIAPRARERRIEHEERHDPLELTHRRAERRVVVDAQVPREEDDGGAHAMRLDNYWTRSPVRSRIDPAPRRG